MQIEDIVEDIMERNEETGEDTPTGDTTTNTFVQLTSDEAKDLGFQPVASEEVREDGLCNVVLEGSELVFTCHNYAVVDGGFVDGKLEFLSQNMDRGDKLLEKINQAGV